MKIIEAIYKKAKTIKKTILLPESEDERVQEASRIVEKEGIAIENGSVNMSEDIVF